MEAAGLHDDIEKIDEPSEHYNTFSPKIEELEEIMP